MGFIYGLYYSLVPLIAMQAAAALLYQHKTVYLLHSRQTTAQLLH